MIGAIDAIPVVPAATGTGQRQNNVKIGKIALTLNVKIGKIRTYLGVTSGGDLMCPQLLRVRSKRG
jgi:hypothetical protein